MDGVLAPQAVFVDYPHKTVNIDRWGTPVFWLTDIPYANVPPAYPAGMMTDQSPIDVVSWTGSGMVHADLLISWGRCLLMLMRL